MVYMRLIRAVKGSDNQRMMQYHPVNEMAEAGTEKDRRTEHSKPLVPKRTGKYFG
jgi:hypothetical protein